MAGMLDRLLSSPAAVKAAAKMAGIQAGRLDYDQARGELWLSLRIHDQIQQIPLPTGQTLTIEQILERLFDPAAVATTAPDPP